MNYRQPSSVCIDDTSFYPLIASKLNARSPLSELLGECHRNEDNFRICWRWLECHDCTSPIAEAAYHCLVDELSKVVTHVHAFHGCRVSAESTYQTEGIKPLTTEWIMAEVRQWASTLPAPDSAAGIMLQDYIRVYGGKVCAVKSLKAHQENGGYGHTQGSETLRKILSLHCPSALERMLLFGEPSVIEFVIPVPMLEDNAWQNFVSDLLRIWLSRQVDFQCPGDPRHGGVVLRRGVPPDWLIRRHVCDNHGALTGKVCDY